MEVTSADNQESTEQPQYPRINHLPRRLQRMITEKRQLRLQWQQLGDPSLKSQLDALCEKLMNEMKEYRESEETWRRRHRQRSVTPEPANQPASTAKYPIVVVETFPNLSKHLKSLKEYFGRAPYAECRHSRIRFIPSDGPEYHAVVQYLKSIEATEPDLKYVIYPLNVCIRGIPSSIPTDAIKTACIERGYLVDHVKQITSSLCYVKICGGKDNTTILEMRELFTFRVRVELWKSGPVKREMEYSESNESLASSSSYATTSVDPAPMAPPFSSEQMHAQSIGIQAADSEDTSTAKYPNIVLESYPNLGKYLKDINDQFGRAAEAAFRHGRIYFTPRDGPEYHAVIKYLKSVQATEPGLKYVVRALDVCIYGLPSSVTTEEVKAACTDRGYFVNQVKLIPTTSVGSLHYVKICGRRDNTRILAMRDLLGYVVKVELWRGGPVRREMERREPTESIDSSTSNATITLDPDLTAPPVGQQLSAQTTGNQAANSEESATAKYPAIVVETFPNWPKHLKNLEKEFGRTAYAEAYYSGIRFVPRDGPEYHAVIKYLKSIKATEPGLKYVVRALDVCIYGLPSSVTTEEVKAACTIRGYFVNQVKLIPTTGVGSLHYVKICGRRDNTRILAMRDLLGYVVKVELWRGGPIRREMERREPNESVTSSTSNATTSQTPPPIPPHRTEYPPIFTEQSTGNQSPYSVASAPVFPPLRPEQVGLVGQSAVSQGLAAAPSLAPPPIPPHRTEYPPIFTAQPTGNQSAYSVASAPAFPPLRPQQVALYGVSQGPAAPMIPAISPEQLAALTAQITSLTLTVIQIFVQQRDHNQ